MVRGRQPCQGRRIPAPLFLLRCVGDHVVPHTLLEVRPRQRKRFRLARAARLLRNVGDHQAIGNALRNCLPSPSLCGQMPDAVTLAPGSCLPLVSLSGCDAGSGLVSFACLSQSLQSDARCCDAGLPLVSLSGALGWCLSLVFPSLCGRMPDAVTSSLCGQMADAVTLAPGSCLPLVLWPDARCCDAGSLSPCVSQSLAPGSPSLCGRMPDSVTPSRLSFCVSQSLRSDARRCDAGSWVVSPACLPVSAVDALAWHPVTGVRLPSALFGSRGSSSQEQLRSVKLET